MRRASPGEPNGGVAAVLAAPTPAAWVEGALGNFPQLLIDHANCEKKAASSALALMFAYPEDTALARALSRVAREELRHFEQVLRLMSVLGVAFARQRPGRYGEALRGALRRSDPGRKLDLLLASALIEARSAERFALLGPRLPPPAAQLYADLGSAEARHYELYLGFARSCAPLEWRTRLAVLAARVAYNPPALLTSGPRPNRLSKRPGHEFGCRRCAGVVSSTPGPQ